MPHAPAKRCTTCGVLVVGGSRCADHGGRAFSGAAPSSGYGAEWQRRRRAHLEEEPNCRQCGAPGTDVDHILARALGGSESDDNLQTLCNPHHRTKTAHDAHEARRRRGRGRQG